MPDCIQIDELLIVGYADELPATMLPTVVPPVFQSRKDPNRIFLPPYHLNGGFLYNSKEVSEAELTSLAEEHEVTLFTTQHDAQKDHDLWIDQKFQPHYEPRADVISSLRQIADGCIAQSVSALIDDQLVNADRLSGIAACADDRRADPFAIKAAIRRHQGNLNGVQLMARLARKNLSNEAFSALVDHYFHLIPKPNCRPMRNVALKHDHQPHPKAA